MQMPIQLPARTSGSEGPLRAVWRCARVAASPGVASSLASSGADVDAPPAKGCIIWASRVDQALSSAVEDGAWPSNSPTTFEGGSIVTDAVQRTIRNSLPQPYENKPYQAHSPSPLIPLVPPSPLLPPPQSPPLPVRLLTFRKISSRPSSKKRKTCIGASAAPSAAAAAAAGLLPPTPSPSPAPCPPTCFAWLGQ